MVDSTRWQDLAAAVACRLEFERRCGRIGLVNESSVVRMAVEYLDSVWPGEIRINEPHPNLNGKYIDLVGLRPRAQKFGFALEAKWIKDGGGTRQWLMEVIKDVFRLQYFRKDMSQDGERILVIAGLSHRLDKELYSKKVKAGGGSPMVTPFPHFLPRKRSTELKQFNIRRSKGTMRRWLTSCWTAFDRKQLPSTYLARKVGSYKTVAATEDGCSVHVWLICRPKNWSTFSPRKTWALGK